MRSRLKPSQGAPEGAHQGLSAHRQTAQAASELTTKQSGDAGEDQALRYLTRAGLQLVVRHYRTPGRGGGEIDLIMREPDGTLVFVEVRSRKLGRFGGAAVTVGPTKQRRILLAARHYLMRWRAWPPCRFDVVAIDGGEVSWIKAAFEAA